MNIIKKTFGFRALLKLILTKSLFGFKLFLCEQPLLSDFYMHFEIPRINKYKFDFKQMFRIGFLYVYSCVEPSNTV